MVEIHPKRILINLERSRRSLNKKKKFLGLKKKS